MILLGFMKHMSDQVAEYSKEKSREVQRSGSSGQLSQYLGIICTRYFTSLCFSFFNFEIEESI